MSKPYETVSQIMAERDQFRAELAAIKAGRGEAVAVAVVVSAYGDPEAFGERKVKVLADLRKIPYGTKLYAAPPALPTLCRCRGSCWGAWLTCW